MIFSSFFNFYKKKKFFLPVITITVRSNGDIKLEVFVAIVRLHLAQIPLDPRASQHDPAEPIVKRVLSRHNPDVLGTLNPESILSEHVFYFIQTRGERRNEVVNVVQQANGDVLKK
jgi:hypothetical protein